MRASFPRTVALASVLALFPSGETTGGEERGGLLSASADNSLPRARSHRVVIEEIRFEPARLSVAPGDTVTWINRDVVPHTVTAADRAWNSGALDEGDRWSLVVGDGGSVDYTCLFHPTMSGRLVRQGRPDPTGAREPRDTLAGGRPGGGSRRS